MRLSTRAIAALELALILPASLFMAALVARNLSPIQFEPANTAQQIVMWYAGRMWTLWILLLAFPLAVLISGCATLLSFWDREVTPQNAPWRSATVAGAHPMELLIAAMTLAAACILAIVVLHMLAN